ncbi:CCL3 protein, partial [Nothoprocta ornata]|nr:CCL3 protein [Nothoprocta pentlandii]NWY07478.1 CCL3 protein [Nothoprocta ornata]
SAALYTPTECCLRHAQRPVRLINLWSFYETPGECSLPATVFVTLHGDKICADPERRWVKKAKNMLGRKK